MTDNACWCETSHSSHGTSSSRIAALPRLKSCRTEQQLSSRGPTRQDGV